MLETPPSDAEKLEIKKLWPGFNVNVAAGIRFAIFAHIRGQLFLLPICVFQR